MKANSMDESKVLIPLMVNSFVNKINLDLIADDGKPDYELVNFSY